MVDLVKRELRKRRLDDAFGKLSTKKNIRKFKRSSKFIVEASGGVLRDTGRNIGKRVGPMADNAKKFVTEQVKAQNELREAERKAFKKESFRIQKQKGRERARRLLGGKTELKQPDLGGEFLFGKKKGRFDI